MLPLVVFLVCGPLLLAAQQPRPSATKLPLIAGYRPGSDVTEHLRLDLDQRDFELFLAEQNFSAAADIYTRGGNSRKTCELQLAGPLGREAGRGAVVQAGLARAALAADAAPTDTKLKIVMESSCSSNYARTPDNSGCFQKGAALEVAGQSGGVVADISMNYRNLAGFSLAAETKMAKEPVFQQYKNYFGLSRYADKFIKLALKGEDDSKRERLVVEFRGAPAVTRVESAKKGSAYWAVWMYVIHEMEDAIRDCQSGCQLCNNAPVHAWDEAVAFYAGSLEGEQGGEGGKLLYRLAEKRCRDFKTCENGVEGRARVNSAVMRLFQAGRAQLEAGNCSLNTLKHQIVELMTVPLVQGTLRYAHRLGRGGGSHKEKAEAAAFLGAILPRVDGCSPAVAAQLTRLLWRPGGSLTSAAGWRAARTALESTYPCLGISCDMVGGHVDAAGRYFSDFQPCAAGAAGPLISAGLLLSLLLFVNF